MLDIKQTLNVHVNILKYLHVNNLKYDWFSQTNAWHALLAVCSNWRWIRNTRSDALSGEEPFMRKRKRWFAVWMSYWGKLSWTYFMIGWAQAALQSGESAVAAACAQDKHKRFACSKLIANDSDSSRVTKIQKTTPSSVLIQSVHQNPWISRGVSLIQHLAYVLWWAALEDPSLADAECVICAESFAETPGPKRFAFCVLHLLWHLWNTLLLNAAWLLDVAFV